MPGQGAKAAKTAGGVGCDLYPGTTTVAWSPKDKFKEVVISWLYEDPATGATTPVGTPVTVKTKPAASPFSTPTPQGANTWGARFFDKKGNVIAVAGGVCD
jgi:hypothetical protein